MNAPVSEFTDYDVSETQQRLDNWRQWARPRMHYRVTPSLEGRYKPPPSWHPPEARIEIDLNDALKVERAIVKLPHPYKQVIIYTYIHPYLDLRLVTHPRLTCNVLHRIYQYETFRTICRADAGHVTV